ncbi:MAG: uracil-DNA glycosylase family protein [Lentisphaeria bacterium]|nr:uracil-DNA glycosylase family protein [Lentisphaeria bacterium]
MSVEEYIGKWNEILRKKGKVKYKLVDGELCEFGCYSRQSGSGLPGIFEENGWIVRKEEKGSKSAKASFFEVIAKNNGGREFKFLLRRTPNYLLIKPYSEDGVNHGGKELLPRFHEDVEESGIDKLFCEAFPVSAPVQRNNGGSTQGSGDKGKTPHKNWKDDKLNNREKDFILCDDRVVSSKMILDILKEVFPVNISGILEERCEKMRLNYLKKEWTAEDWRQGGLGIEDGGKYKDALLRVPTDGWGDEFAVCNLGHDLPVWCYYRDKCPDLQTATRIMIVSQDPKRSGHNAGQLLLSSPWALHSRSYLRDKLPQHILHELLERRAIVYMTDFCKLYATKEVNDKENIFAGKDGFLIKMKEILNREIQAFKPNHMITFGNMVAQALFDEGVDGDLKRPKKAEYKGCECRIAYHPGYVERIMRSNMCDGVNYFLEGLFPDPA